jgi:hypothetical protein
MMSVLSLCTDTLMLEKSDESCSMGVDTGKDLHVVILRGDDDDYHKQHVVHLAVCHTFSDLDALMARFKVDRCVIDGMPETHANREFAGRHRGNVFMSFFNENQRGNPNWNHHEHKVEVNRTEALDMSRVAIREKKITLPRRNAMLELFARHMSCDAKQLEENPETGMKKYRYIRTGEDHFSLAFTYAWLASLDHSGARGWLAYYRKLARERGHSGSPGR